jgi:putative transposase
LSEIINIDDFNQEGLNKVMDISLSRRRVIRKLNQLIEWRGQPLKIRVDNGPEFIAQALGQWAEERGIKLKFIETHCSYQNGYVERFNRSFREEMMDAYAFETIRMRRRWPTPGCGCITMSDRTAH